METSVIINGDRNTREGETKRQQFTMWNRLDARRQKRQKTSDNVISKQRLDNQLKNNIGFQPK